MINLLPDQIKEEIVYAKRNCVVVKWICSVLLIIVILVGMTIFGQIFINKNASSIQSVTELTNQRIEDQNLESTQQDIEALSTNFKTVTQLLSQQLLFSKLFTKIGSIMPADAILSGITLIADESSIDLNIAATNKEAATQAFINISDPENGLFEEADLISVNCSSTSTSSKPCAAVVKVVMEAGSNYYFLNSIINGETNER
jgi:hypothetical protein